MKNKIIALMALVMITGLCTAVTLSPSAGKTVVNDPDVPELYGMVGNYGIAEHLTAISHTYFAINLTNISGCIQKPIMHTVASGTAGSDFPYWLYYCYSEPFNMSGMNWSTQPAIGMPLGNNVTNCEKMIYAEGGDFVNTEIGDYNVSGIFCNEWVLFMMGGSSNITNLDGNNRRQFPNPGDFTLTYDTLVTTTTLPPCMNSSQCPSGELCNNGTCQITSEQCFVDSDCESTKWCDTRIIPNMCTFKFSDGSACARNHHCISGNCTAHTNNSNMGDYPPDASGYSMIGVCASSNITACTNDTDCNATSFCNKVGQWGSCELKRELNQSCSAPSWCITGLTCINGICQNQSGYTGDQCNPNNPDSTSYGKPIWSTCRELNSTICPSDDWCFCGKQTNTSTINTCIPRIARLGTCSLFRSGYSSIEDRYQDRDEACNVGYACNGYSISGELKRVCIDNSYQCFRTVDQDGNKQPNTFTDEYCQRGYYCEDATHQCLSQIQYGTNCTLSEQCGSYTCVNGVCGIGNLTAGNTIIDITPSSSVLAVGQSLWLNVNYRYTNGTNIRQGTCTLVYDTMYFNTTSSTLTFIGGDIIKYQSNDIYAINTTGIVNRTIGVTCSKTGIAPKTNYIYILILGTTAGTPTTGLCSPCPSGSMAGTGVTFGIKYLYANNQSIISTATCNLNIDGTTTAMTYSGGKYTTTKTLNEGSHPYSMTCYKTGLQNATVTGIVAISVGNCHNGVHDDGEEGVDCGGVCTQACPSTCNNGIKNNDETDVDCGGTSRCQRCDEGQSCQKNTDCQSSLWCRPHWGNVYDTTATRDYHCRTPTCNDGWINGGESGIDCGGACTVCPCSDTYSLAGCLTDGSESCNITAGACTVWNCNTNADCPPLTLRESGVYYSNDRVCVNGLCKFKSGAGYINSTIVMRVYPLSGIIYTNGTDVFYIGACDDYTNGFRITTNKTTHTQYQIGISPYVPSIIATGQWDTFGQDGTTKTDTIRALCEWTSGTMRNARLGLHSEIPNSGIKEDKTVDMIIFREAYIVNFTGLGDEINFTANRESTFYIRGRTIDPFTQLNAAPAMSLQTYYRNITNTTMIEWYSNDTYGEHEAGTYSRDAILLMFMLAGIGWDLLFGWWLPSWSYWFIIPIIFSMFVIFPLAISFMIYMYMRRKESQGGG